MPVNSATRLVAFFEGLKGAVVLLAATGLLALVHRDVHALAAALVAHAHLNPAAAYPKIFLDASTQLNDARLWQLAAGAAAYAGLRCVEAYGLYKGRAWAEVLAVLSGAVYIPFEVYEIFSHPSGLALVLFALNVAVVAVMLRALYRRRRLSRLAA